MKIIKYITVILIIAAFTTGCNSVKKTLRGDKDQNIDEFLVKKKIH